MGDRLRRRPHGATVAGVSLAPDTDGDGTCDAIDPCTNVGHGQDFIAALHPKVVLTHINTDPTPGNETLALVGVFRLASGATFTGLDPAARGARLVLQNRLGATRLDVTLAAGTFRGKGTRGWTENGSHTTWTFRDATGSPASGIASVQIKNRSKRAAREVGVTVVGRKGTYPVAAGNEPVHATVVLGNQTDGAAGSCGESAFVAGNCTFNGKGGMLTCRQ